MSDRTIKTTHPLGGDRVMVIRTYHAADVKEYRSTVTYATREDRGNGFEVLKYTPMTDIYLVYREDCARYSARKLQDIHDYVSEYQTR